MFCTFLMSDRACANRCAELCCCWLPSAIEISYLPLYLASILEAAFPKHLTLLLSLSGTRENQTQSPSRCRSFMNKCATFVAKLPEVGPIYGAILRFASPRFSCRPPPADR